MRIGIFTDTYLPVSNGICYVIDIIRKDLEAAGHEVHVVAPQNIFRRPASEAGIIRINALQGLFYSDNFLSFFWPPRQMRKLRQYEFDLTFAFTPSLIGGLGAYVAIESDIPYVVQYGTDMEAYAKDYRLTTIVGLIVTMVVAPFFLKLGAKRTLRFYRSVFRRPTGNYYSYVTRLMMEILHEKAAAVIATSDKVAQKLASWPIRQNIVTIPTGVDALPSRVDLGESYAKKFGITSTDQVVMYAGRLGVEKNLERLIAAFSLLAKKNKNAKLLLAGDFQHRKVLEELAEASGFKDRIIFAGLLPREDLGSVYRLATVFVFPSLTDCQGLVINEAAHAGLPLVWCDDDNLNPVLADGYSGLRAKNTDKDLADKVNRLLKEKGLRRKLGRQAKIRAGRFSEPAQTVKIEALLKGLLTKG